MTDHVYRLALARTSRLSVEVEAQITSRVKSEPLLVVLHTAKEQAADALQELAEVDPTDANAIRKLQNEIARFADITRWLTQMLLDGPEADRELNELQMKEARDLVLSDEETEQLGIPTEGNHDD